MKELVHLSQEELKEVVSYVGIAMKGHIKRFMSAISVRRSLILNSLKNNQDDAGAKFTEIQSQLDESDVTQTEAGSRPSRKC